MKDAPLLIEDYLDGDLTSDEEERLADWLAADPDHVRQFVRATHLHRQIRETMLARRFQTDAPATVENAERESLASPVRVLTQLFALPLAPRMRRAWLPLTACVAIIVGLGVWFFGPTMGEPVLAELKGMDASIERGTEFIPAANGMVLQPADLLRLGTNASATIAFGAEKTRLELAAGTDLKFLNWQRGKHFELQAGRIEASVARQRPFKPMLVRTPQAEARVLGTEFELATTNNTTRLEVAEGKVRFTRAIDATRVDVPAGYYADAAARTELSALPKTGNILREFWTGIPRGGGINDLLYHPAYPSRPAARDFVESFETDEVQTNNFGCRLIGYVHPPVTGEYTFWIAAAANAILWLSPDENPAGKVRIASAPGGLPRQWDARPQGVSVGSPQSPPVTLVAGRRYFIQAVQKTGRGSSHLAVAWQRPGSEREVVPGEFLSPFKPK